MRRRWRTNEAGRRSPIAGSPARRSDRRQQQLAGLLTLINAGPKPGAMVNRNPQQEPAMRRQQPPPPAPPEPAVEARIVARPDGYYWLTADGRRETGPFATYEEAQFDLRADEESDLEPAETLAEAESEIGIADWIDPETGTPAEEERPRIEDH
jgi:hypothetical protein